MVVLKVEQLSKTYGAGELQVHALKEINFDIEKGYFYSIIGKSGSGKSTLMHLIGALDQPTTGKVFIDGVSVFDLKDSELTILRRKKIGFVFQAYNLLPEYTVLENILLPLYADKQVVDEDYFNQIVSKLGIKEKLKFYPNELSGGQQQRVAIARAMITKPAILLADEPTGNLDPASGNEVLELLKATGKQFHQTIVMVTHDMDIADMADRVVVIEDGIVKEIKEH